MKTVIDSISEVHGEYPGSVDVSFHREDDDGTRDGFEHRRVHLTDAVIKPDGSINQDEVNRQAEQEVA